MKLLMTSEYFSEGLIRLVTSLNVESSYFSRHSLSLLGQRTNLRIINVKEQSWLCKKQIKLCMIVGKLLFTKFLPEIVDYERSKCLDEGWQARHPSFFKEDKMDDN